ncbi:MAG: hypothetical protein Q7T42_08710 [Methylotenera sp.]|uniref:hypothetical protein n=1 Tax=Methylotenera sp. TaxID=2051956 RepID=UPI00272557CE|nr:hypothetical protein [Methylotenera sp.]MDO9394035.1 hypothetical protein [Methylotenera sp.]MDP3330852.1 hypothetical protein [Methylococcaceae bacterium]
MNEAAYLWVAFWAIGLGQIFGYRLIDIKRDKRHDIPLVIVSIVVVITSSYPDYVLIFAGIILYVLMAGFIPFVHFLKRIDDERAFKKKTVELNQKRDYK